jgi:hypothetical protein
MDLPWNPAVLEQRIGRVHRLGQKQPVRVVNFVAQGTIEEGMLSVIKFKKSLFAGVLDGGEKEVFLGGNRLNRFMETVEKASSAIPEPAIADPASTQEANGEPLAAETDQGPATTAPAAQTQSTSLAGLLQTGLKLLEELALASRSASSSRTDHSQGESAGRNSNTSHGLAASWIGRDEQTGQSFLKLPMPKPEVLDQALQAIGALLEGWSGPRA